MIINGITQSPLIGTISFQSNINARSTLSFSILTDSLISVGQEVEYYDGVKLVFGGQIESYSKSYLQGNGAGVRTRYDVQCVDYNAILDRLLVAKTYVNETFEDLVTDLWSIYLDSEGVALGSIAMGSKVIKQAVFNYINMASCFNYLRDILGINYNIDSVSRFNTTFLTEFVDTSGEYLYETTDGYVYETTDGYLYTTYGIVENVVFSEEVTGVNSNYITFDKPSNSLMLGETTEAEGTGVLEGVAETTDDDTKVRTNPEISFVEDTDLVFIYYPNTMSRASAITYITGGSFVYENNTTERKILRFFENDENIGEEINDSLCRYMTLEETRQEYRNTQYVRAGDSTTSLQVKEKPSPGPDGVSKTFTLRFPIALKPTLYLNDVEIDDINVGINGLDQNKEWYWSYSSRTITQDDGTTTLTSGDKLEVSYSGLKPILVKADNVAGIDDRKFIEGGTGQYQMIKTELNITNKDGAFELANGLLQRYGTIPRNVFITTEELRNAGEIITVQSDNLGLDEQFLITDINVVVEDSGKIVYNLKCASGEDLGGWVEFFRNLVPKGELTIKENEVLFRLLNIRESSGIQGRTTIKRFNALFPSEILYPSETLTPGTFESEVTLND